MSYLRESWLRPLVLSGDMLGSRGFVLLTIFNFIFQISKEESIYTNGWMPMSHNDIYNQMRRMPTEYPVYFSTKPSLDYDNNLLQTKINTEPDFGHFKESFEVLKGKPYEAVTPADITEKYDSKEVNTKENTRKAKKLWNRDINVNDDYNLEHSKNNFKSSVTNENTSINKAITVTATSKAYEVIEDSDKPLVIEDNFATENVEYQYNPPTDKNEKLTSTFYKILSKYNINSEDKLPNYELSLQRKAPNPLSSVFKIPLPYGYNNLNHLPVDPLLAVFLSNYGFYLPSLYGIKANYNNLYGYLASNNIRNNKPFGLYKVFSDTDSWN